MTIKNKLFEAALAVRENSYSPLSNFKVGASILTDKDEIYAGCNVENASHPCGQCAEASAIGRMVSQGGAQKIKMVCIIADAGEGEGVFSCGNCLQRIAEFGDSDTLFLCSDPTGIQREYTLNDLLPKRFSCEHLK